MANKTKRTDIFSIDPRNIMVAEGFNSRVDFGDIDVLAQQIKESGLKNPIHVQKAQGEEDKYTLVDGERRYRAIMKLIEQGEQIDYVKAIIVPANTPKLDLYVEQAMCNEGKPFTNYEYAVLAKKIYDECHLTYAEIGRKLGKETGTIQYFIEMFTWPERWIALVRDGKLCLSDVRRILSAYIKPKKDPKEKNEFDFDAAWADVEKLEKNAKDKGEHNLSLKSLKGDMSSKTRVHEDTKVILKGIEMLGKYTEEYKKRGAHLQMSLPNLRDALKSGKLITDVLDEALGLQQQEVRKAV